MAEDKYAPKTEDDAKEIHNKHMWLIKDEQAANKQRREEYHNAGKLAEEAKPEKDHVDVPSEPPGGKQAAGGAAAPSDGGPAL